MRTLSAPIYFSNPPGVFGHRAILTMGGGGRTVAGGFLIEQTDLFQKHADKVRLTVCHYERREGPFSRSFQRFYILLK